MYVWDFAALKPYWGLICQGLLVTVYYTVTTVVAGLAIGLFVGILRTTAPRWITVPLRLYIEVFRCTPLLVQLIWFYYALPRADRRRHVAGDGLRRSRSRSMRGSFYAEIFRGGIISIDTGQWEAGARLGMTRGKIMRRIVLPQATQAMIPPFVNQSIMQLKNTSLVSVVAVADLIYPGTIIVARPYRPLEVYTSVAVLYFVDPLPLTAGRRAWRRRVDQ